jgi:hypothetical protein
MWVVIRSGSRGYSADTGEGRGGFRRAGGLRREAAAGPVTLVKLPGEKPEVEARE